jgi:hypothetical protein
MLVDQTAISFDEQILFFAFQGLANRDGANVWYYQPAFWTYPDSTFWFPPNYLGPVKGYTFTNVTSFCDLVESYPVVQGLAMYDATVLDAQRWLAVTYSGIANLLPVTETILGMPEYGCLKDMSVVQDFRNRFSTNLEAYGFALSNIMPMCNHTFAYSAGHSYNDSTEAVYLGNDPAIDMGLDTAVALQAFVFNLSPDNGKYPTQAAMWINIVMALNPGRLVFGWAEPEPAMTASTSVAGGSVVCDAAPNLSFWLHVASKYPTLPYNARNTTLDPTKTYVTFQTNEGDTPKILASIQGGMWLDPRRGSIPIAWGIDPLVATYAPGLVEFFTTTATANDTFFAATAGAGYSYPWSMLPNDFQTYVDRAARLIDSLTPTYPPNVFNIDIWDNNRLNNLTSYKNVAGTAVGLFTQQPEELAGTNNWLADGTPVVIGYKELWYPCQSNASTYDGMEQALRAIMAANPPPYFTVIYGCLQMTDTLNTYDFAFEMQSRLGGAGLEIVGIHDLANLARQAHAQGHAKSSSSVTAEEGAAAPHRGRPDLRA